MTDNAKAVALKPCPFCRCDMRVESNRDWHRLVGDHEASCVMYGFEPEAPATEADENELVADWNTRPTLAPEDVRRIMNLIYDAVEGAFVAGKHSYDLGEMTEQKLAELRAIIEALGGNGK